MLKEFSCGAVVYKIDCAGPLFLLVHSKRSGRWGFPKGHIEEGESEIEAAGREIFEETGIKKVQFTEGFRQEDIYMIAGAVAETEGRIAKKHSIYFLCKALEEPAGFDKEEITELRWADIDESIQLLSFENQKEIINKAYYKIKDKHSLEEKRNG